ncbi:hypothetical protein K4F52_008360 [Lecanicillium sp. MT-2017a]|nr:hypothetical protein K4F52_008360 [Lecanicillium sp. MT-2017a]
MARLRKSRMKGNNNPAEPETIVLEHPNRDGPRVGEKTLFELAEERRLMQQADARRAANRASKAANTRRASLATSSVASGSDEGREDSVDGDVPTLSPTAERALEASLWTVSLAMLHFTFDVLVQHQYGTEINWGEIGQRTLQAWAAFNSRSAKSFSFA